MTIAIQSQISNPITGVFGTGQVQIFSTSGVWTVPPGIGKVRVRLWGAGSTGGTYSSLYLGSGGGGFALKTIYDLSGVASIPVTVGTSPTSPVTTVGAFQVGGTSSFGSYASATGGTGAGTMVGGIGIGGDINTSGGTGASASTSAANTSSGGGAGSLFGNGGNAGSGIGVNSTGGGGGSGGGTTSMGGSSLAALGAIGSTTGPQTGFIGAYALDFIGTGGGGNQNFGGINGGGGGSSSAGGGFPGGGGAYSASTGVALGGGGLVIVEY